MVATANQAGPAVVLSFVISGLACTFAFALSYSELASSVGGCGSAYGYEYVTFGELITLIGWTSLSLFLYFIYGYKNSNLNR